MDLIDVQIEGLIYDDLFDKFIDFGSKVLEMVSKEIVKSFSF